MFQARTSLTEQSIFRLLGYSNNQLSKADYLHIEENQFTVIELSDLRDQIQACHHNIRQQEEDLFNKLQMETPGLKKLPVKEKK
ncbi:hypothetical protein VA7868_02280 [Vibrio aerogenes CECT 7868]|uniref:Uncharacterized protein n=1 Tax=Vibrio aerogenes CECT 7868 TaxID=1216006 RepID=A0A1M5Z4R3_9VIBR|nr:hypothetical protein [Vibrio aerogenes]SHI19124.1 hypothetical protein VA7868_02280 [Vibrio aerogenes CECT 7868]